ncbi:MAG: hypothetical protein H6667_09590 [Ardenticatenaceae bacterium]|nr:hypothetical protein [Ardenticatenaceae bacterium]MCB9443454.1 hypothetical protein [Ardenticatenaceae bacterium]
MVSDSQQLQIVVIPKVFVPYKNDVRLNKKEKSSLIHNNIPMIWIQDGLEFRLDVTLPEASTLEVLFPPIAETLTVNGRMVWKKSLGQLFPSEETQAEEKPTGLILKCNSGGALHILATFQEKTKPNAK